MNGFLVRLLALWLTVTPVYADSSFVAPSATGQATTGQIPGTATNDNASAGNVGEYRSASNADTGQVQSGATVTITIASPGVVTWGTTIPFVCNGNGTAVINFTTTGALPTGIVSGTNYYAVCSSISGNTFQIATSADNAIAGTAINTSGTQSGVQTGVPTAIMTTGGGFNVAAMSLTAGDWDVVIDLGFFSNTTTSITALTLGTSTTSASLASGFIPGRVWALSTAAEVPGVANNILHAGPGRFSLSATTTVYCIASGNFTISTLAAWGGCRARRIR